VYLLCPVAPFGMRVAASALQRLMDGSSDSTAHAWLLVSCAKGFVCAFISCSKLSAV
jgi:hypothetical protein